MSVPCLLLFVVSGCCGCCPRLTWSMHMRKHQLPQITGLHRYYETGSAAAVAACSTAKDREAGEWIYSNALTIVPDQEVHWKNALGFGPCPLLFGTFGRTFLEKGDKGDVIGTWQYSSPKTALWTWCRAECDEFVCIMVGMLEHRQMPENRCIEHDGLNLTSTLSVYGHNVYVSIDV